MTREVNFLHDKSREANFYNKDILFKLIIVFKGDRRQRGNVRKNIMTL